MMVGIKSMKALVLTLFLVVKSTYSLQSFFQKFSPPSSNPGTSSCLKNGDTICVVGASGNVGKLLAIRLSDTFKINGIVRDASSVSNFFAERSNISLFESNNLVSGSTDDFIPALESANAVVFCTGTTAFPTKAWSKSRDSSIGKDVLKSLLENQFNIKDSISSLDEQYFNTPNNIDNVGTKRILDTWKRVAKSKRKRTVFISSIGVERRDEMPFPILNACGVLDAKSFGEQAIIEDAALDESLSYTIVRPGQLFGGPYDNNYYLGTLFQLEKDATVGDIALSKGDTLTGDTIRTTLAEVVAQMLEGEFAKNMDVCVINKKGDVPSLDVLKERLAGLNEL